MIIVIDANIFISAIIKESTTRRIIIESNETFLFPEIIFEEIREHRGEISRKSRLSNREYDKLVTTLLKYVTVVPTKIIDAYREEATRIMGHIDKDDVLFIATAIAFEKSLIWSNDPHFERQNRIKILKTRDMLDMNE